MAKNVLITAGPTRAYIDAVRYISNFATGRLGVEIAEEAYAREYNVKLVYGPGTAKVPGYIPKIDVETVDEMLKAVLDNIQEADIFIANAAVLDFAPRREDRKIKSNAEKLVVEFYATPKIIKEAKKAARAETAFVLFKLGYKMKKEDLIAEARSYGGDICVANDLSEIHGNKHHAYILTGNREIEVHTKREIARKIFDCLEGKL